MSILFCRHTGYLCALTFYQAVGMQKRSRCGLLSQAAHFWEMVAGGVMHQGERDAGKHRKCVKIWREATCNVIPIPRVDFDKAFSCSHQNPRFTFDGPVLWLCPLAYIWEKRLHLLFVPGRKTICGTQDRAGPSFCNLGSILCPKSQEQLVLRRLSAALDGCPSAQGLDWVSSQDDEWPGLCSRTCLFQDHRWKPPLQPHTDSPQYGNPSSRKWNRNTKHDPTQYQGAFFLASNVNGSTCYVFSVVFCRAQSLAHCQMVIGTQANFFWDAFSDLVSFQLSCS